MGDDVSSIRLRSTLFIGGLSPAVTAPVLHSAFIPFGEIVDVSLPKPENPNNRDTHKGFGYLELSNPEDAAEAIDNMDQSELYGRVIKVAQAKPSQAAQREAAGEGVLGSKVALWEQEGYLSKQSRDEDQTMDTTGAAGEDMREELRGLDEAGPRG